MHHADLGCRGRAAVHEISINLVICALGMSAQFVDQSKLAAKVGCSRWIAVCVPFNANALAVLGRDSSLGRGPHMTYLHSLTWDCRRLQKWDAAEGLLYVCQKLLPLPYISPIHVMQPRGQLLGIGKESARVMCMTS